MCNTDLWTFYCLEFADYYFSLLMCLKLCGQHQLATSLFFLQSNRLRTKTVHKTRNPEFNETLTFYGVTDGDVKRKMLHILILGKL